MSFFHTTIKDAIKALERDDRDKARKIIREHHRNFLHNPNFSSGRQLEVLQSLLAEWSDVLEILSDDSVWEAESDRLLVQQLTKIEENIAQIKEILRELHGEEKNVLE